MRVFVQNVLLKIYQIFRRAGVFDSLIFLNWVFLPCYFLYKRWNEDRLAVLAKAHPEFFLDGHLFDVGANVGYTARILAQYVSPGFSVHCFEPDQKNFELLKRVVARAARREQVVLHRCIVGKSSGISRLWVNRDNPADHQVLNEHLVRQLGHDVEAVDVKAIALDDWALRQNIASPISFIKIDVQGFEPEVLEGMENLIAANPNLKILIEYSPGALQRLGFLPENMLNFLRDRKFALFRVGTDGSLSPFVPNPQIEYEDILCQRAQ
jgi:FkbM family methyltransferase